jgi:hypothetical protein
MLKQQILAKEVSRIKTAHSKSPSLRTTIPQKIVSDAKLQADDVLEWEVYVEKGRTYMRVRKME